MREYHREAVKETSRLLFLFFLAFSERRDRDTGRATGEDDGTGDGRGRQERGARETGEGARATGRGTGEGDGTGRRDRATGRTPTIFYDTRSAEKRRRRCFAVQSVVSVL